MAARAINFDRLAPHYDWLEALGAGQLMQQARTRWLDELAGSREVLSIGEGHGRFAEAFVRRFPAAHLTCVDASPRMLAKAQQRVARVRGAAATASTTWIQAELPAWKPPARRYDTLVTCFALDCLSPAQLEDAIPALSCGATDTAQWLHVDFTLPASGFARARARLIERSLYAFFRATTHIPASHLVAVDPLLTAAGFARVRHDTFSFGLVSAELWRRT